MHTRGVLCLCLEPQAFGVQLSASFRALLVKIHTEKFTATVEYNKCLQRS